MSEHGTISRHRAGCRCRPCQNIAARTVLAAQHRRALDCVTGTNGRAYNPNVPTHGTVNGYNNYRCRCDACTAANTAQSTANRRYNARKKTR